MLRREINAGRSRSFVHVPKSPGYSCRADELLDVFFNAPRQISFRECYFEITGDSRATGQLKDCDPIRMREALGTNDWPNVLGAAITRRMVADYRRDTQYSIWRRLANVVNVTDFRTQIRGRIGGYGDLPAVAQASPYLQLVSPAEEVSTYALTKRGGTDSITLEAIRNDNIGAIRKIPQRLAQAAHRTLAHFVLDFLRVNAPTYDGINLFHASHGNLASSALSSTAFAAGRAAMRAQTEPGSGDRLTTEPATLWVPLDLEEAACNLFRRGANQDRTFVQAFPVEVVPVWYWTDTNDWCLSADPADVPTIEIGFLDGNDEPELFLQDSPAVGAMFSNDQLTWKIRHIYGGNVVDYRPLYKSVV